ncbi:MAG: helix-turn-helix domain-containing protein [Clostridia bacterium]|nr:helix-turn-helix domain-containing protein [Clostridia bacterium]
MDEKQFALRLAQLRENKGVSAREMSLAIGQNAGYINNIESGKSLPSLTGFFYICEYLDVSENEFFDLNSVNPSRLDSIVKQLKFLDDTQLNAIFELVKVMNKK